LEVRYGQQRSKRKVGKRKKTKIPESIKDKDKDRGGDLDLSALPLDATAGRGITTRGLGATAVVVVSAPNAAGTPHESSKPVLVGDMKAWCLVVDDVAPNRVLLARGLKRLGYATHLACDGKEALEACRLRGREVREAGVGLQSDKGSMKRSQCLGLITMDKSMPVMDGI